MAGPTEEQLEQELINQFDAYLTEVKRLLVASATNVKHAVSTARINGYTLADLVAIIRGEVTTHENDPNNPHSNTLAALGGLSTSDYELQAAQYYPKDGIPLSRYPSLGLTINGNQLTVAAATVVLFGRKVAVPATTSGVLAPSNQYLKLTITGKAPNRTPTYSLSTDQSEDVNKCIVAYITYSNGVFSATPLPCTRLGASRVSQTPHGLSIPASSGTQAAPGSINPAWFS